MVSRILSFVLLVASVVTSSRGQIIGDDICACSPNTYEFTLDFALFCPPVNVTEGDAVLRTGCLVNPVLDPNVADLIPVAVNSIDIVELDQDLTVIVQENIAGNFGSGDTFSYTSFAANPDNIITSRDLPKAIQMNLYGVNEQDEALVNSWIIQFTNNCGSYPVLFEGQSAGWVRFSDLGPPRGEFCPLAILPTDTPTKAPTTPFPTRAPTTPSPTQSPVPLPTREPTTPAPVTPAPVEMSMSMSMMMDLFTGMDEIVDHEFGLRMAGGRNGVANRAGDKLKKLAKMNNRAPTTKKAKKTKKNAEEDSKKGMKKGGKKNGKKEKVATDNLEREADSMPILEPDSEDVAAGEEPRENPTENERHHKFGN